MTTTESATERKVAEDKRHHLVWISSIQGIVTAALAGTGLLAKVNDATLLAVLAITSQVGSTAFLAWLNRETAKDDQEARHADRNAHQDFGMRVVGAIERQTDRLVAELHARSGDST